MLFSLAFSIIIILLLIVYWIIPFEPIHFSSKNFNANFSLINSSEMQFYLNMRFPEKNISYFIYDCPLKKKNDMEQAFEEISSKTILSFYEKEKDEEISVTCDSNNKMDEGLFIAGEGGPTNIVGTDLFSVIFNGKILLVKESTCPNPNVAIHELLHVLGFGHSENPDNIMYYLSKCRQTIGEDQIDFINDLYKIPSYSDLYFSNVSSFIQNGFLEAVINVKNQGLKDSNKARVFIYADAKLIEDINLDSIKVGEGIKMTLKTRLGLLERNAKELEFFIDSNFSELDKSNNKIILEVN